MPILKVWNDTTWIELPGGGMANVVEDLTPQLGGDLDLNGKQITGFTADRALETDDTGKMQVSAVTQAELNFLDGVTSAIQTQIDTKVTGPGSATDSFVCCFDGTTGKLILARAVSIDVTGNISMVPGRTVDGKDVSTLIASLVEDTTPQLGGDLDLNTHSITGVSLTGKIYLLAAGGRGTTTAPAGDSNKDAEQTETTTNKIDDWNLAFDATTAEGAYWVVPLPGSYDGGTVKARFHWSNESGLTTETVMWELTGLALGNDDANDQAYGTPQQVSDTWLAQGDEHVSGYTPDITIGGSPAAGTRVIFKVTRKTASDNLTGDALLKMVTIEYTRTDLND